jgi:hypothetical protein
MGPVQVRLNPNLATTGEIEEQVNGHPGWLDLDPFHPGDADSFFDVFFEIEVGGMVLHNEQPKRLSTVIRHKPPAQGDAYESLQTIPLLDANGNPTGFSLGSGRHEPDPEQFVEHDHFEETEAQVALIGPDGNQEVIDLGGRDVRAARGRGSGRRRGRTRRGEHRDGPAGPRGRQLDG